MIKKKISFALFKIQEQVFPNKNKNFYLNYLEIYKNKYH